MKTVSSNRLCVHESWSQNRARINRVAYQRKLTDKLMTTATLAFVLLQIIIAATAFFIHALPK